MSKRVEFSFLINDQVFRIVSFLLTKITNLEIDLLHRKQKRKKGVLFYFEIVRLFDALVKNANTTQQI